MYNTIKALYVIGFLEKIIVNNEEIFHLTTPCRFTIEEDIVISLKKNYCADEEIGGIFWAKPTIGTQEKTHIVKKISFLRNVIEDTLRTDHLNKSNSYLPDSKQLHEEMERIFCQGFLPLMFHTHPVKGSDFLQTLMNPNFVSETSDQGIYEKSFTYDFNKQKLLMPSFLIVGNDISSQDIFIGVYNGFVAPQSFCKHSLPVILGLTATIPMLMANTQNLSNPQYFNRLSFGSVDIFISKI